MTVLLKRSEIGVLNSLCDDYECIDTIVGDPGIGRDRRKIGSILEKLHGYGLIDGYTYQVELTKYVVTSKPDFHKDWFLINSEGSNYLDKNWKDGC